jgi:hypothetical protein
MQPPPEVHILVLQTSPEPFHPDVVPHSILPVPTDLDLVAFQYLNEGIRSERTTWIRVNERRNPLYLNRFFQGGDTELRIYRVGHSPTQHLPGIQIQRVLLVFFGRLGKLPPRIDRP